MKRFWQLSAALSLAALLQAACPAAAVCGNGVTEAPEQCDDNNTFSLDGCSEACTVEIATCGNGVIEAGEQCDDNNNTAGDGCDESCRIEIIICGDGVTQGGEQCDDANQIPGDGCENDCSNTVDDVCAGITPTVGTNIKLEPLPDTFVEPLYLTAPVNDFARLFVVEKGGTIRVVKDGVKLATPFLDISDQVSGGNEQGLLSMAFHPNFTQNGKFYVSYTDNGGDSVISQFTVSANPDVANEDEKIILTQTQPFENHNGGLIKFGPDGFLYIGFGDGGSADDPQRNGQDRLTRLGKMLRIDVDNGDPFGLPADNPFIGFASTLNEIWAIGLRNPWRWSFDRLTGDLYIGDVGQGAFEEVDFEPAGSAGGINWGWSDMEGDGHCVNNNNCNDPALGFTNPVAEYTHVVAPGNINRCSITGGYVYRGCALPDVSGTYFYNDVCSKQVFSLKVVNGAATDEQELTTQLQIPSSGVSWGEDARGELYVTDLTGVVLKLVPAP
jgi:cysteine-rich repeat protein